MDLCYNGPATPLACEEHHLTLFVLHPRRGKVLLCCNGAGMVAASSRLVSLKLLTNPINGRWAQSLLSDLSPSHWQLFTLRPLPFPGRAGGSWWGASRALPLLVALAAVQQPAGSREAKHGLGNLTLMGSGLFLRAGVRTARRVLVCAALSLSY